MTPELQAAIEAMVEAKQRYDAAKDGTSTWEYDIALEKIQDVAVSTLPAILALLKAQGEENKHRRTSPLGYNEDWYQRAKELSDATDAAQAALVAAVAGVKG